MHREVIEGIFTARPGPRRGDPAGRAAGRHRPPLRRRPVLQPRLPAGPPTRSTRSELAARVCRRRHGRSSTASGDRRRRPPRRGRGRPRTPGAEAEDPRRRARGVRRARLVGLHHGRRRRRAGVGKSTVYLRWADKDALLTEAVTDQRRWSSSRCRHRHAARRPRGRSCQSTDAPLPQRRRMGRRSGSPSTRRARREDLGQFAEMVTEVHGSKVEQICAAGRRSWRDARRAYRPASVSEMIFGAALINALSERLEGRTDADDDLVERSDRIVDLVVRGIAGGPSSAQESTYGVREAARVRRAPCRAGHPVGVRRVAHVAELDHHGRDVGQVEGRRGRSGSRGRRRRRCSWRPATPGVAAPRGCRPRAASRSGRCRGSTAAGRSERSRGSRARQRCTSRRRGC